MDSEAIIVLGHESKEGKLSDFVSSKIRKKLLNYILRKKFP